MNSLIEEVLDGSFNLLLINLCRKVVPISKGFKIIQSGVIDREYNLEMKKLREAMERLAGNNIQDDAIDI